MEPVRRSLSVVDPQLPFSPPRRYQENSSHAYTTTFSSKRKRGNESNFSDNVLVSLCRSEDWVGVIRRCSSHPNEGISIPINDDRFPQQRFHLHGETNDPHGDDRKQILYYPTALGIVCASDQIGTIEAKRVILGLVKRFPSQISCSQVLSGHTPLRDAILNPKCTHEILGILLEADRSRAKNSTFASFQRDSNGLFPIDHLVMKVQSHSLTQSTDLLRTFIEMKPHPTSRAHDYISPLIRLLTVGTSGDTKFNLFDPFLSKASISDKARMTRILEVSNYLLENDPSLLYECSSVTGCSPLHVALRNYGDFLPLIKEISVRDKSNRLMAMSNNHGDLPIHVASSTGVSLDTLQFVVKRTIAVIQDKKGREEKNLLLIKNNFGYTPMDLEWLHYIESGSGLVSARSFYPFQSAGGNRFFKQDDYYKNMLREAVDQVICKSSNSETTALKKGEAATKVFGVLIERISLIISAASSKTISPVCKRTLLHDACKLCTPYGPSLPLPLLQLMLWIHHDNLLKPDKKGNLPLHYALNNSGVWSEESSSQQCHEWKIFCLDLLKAAPESSKVADQSSRLPLHLLLAGETGGSDMEDQSFRQDLVEKLVELFPESVDSRDPISKLDPFMLSATGDANLPFDTVFFLLRQSPLLCYNAWDD